MNPLLWLLIPLGAVVCGAGWLYLAAPVITRWVDKCIEREVEQFIASLRGGDDITDLAESAGVLLPDTAAALIAAWTLTDAPRDLIPDKEH